MIYIDSKHTETAVSVYAVASSAAGELPSVFRVTVTMPTQNLWHTAQGTSSEQGNDTAISRYDADIDAELAFAIQRTWRVLLAKEPTPTDSDSITLDGYTAVFSVVMPGGETVIRETANPDRAPATELVKAGLDLWHYCTAPASEQGTRREEIIRKLENLVETYGKP